MPELDFALLADRVSTEPGGVGYVMRGGVDTITTASVPTVQFVGLLFRVGFTRVECGRPHRFEVVLQGEDGERLMQTSSVLEPIWNDTLPPHWSVMLLGGLNLPIPLPRYGMYAFEFLLNDHNCKTIHLRVVPTREADPLAQAGDGRADHADDAE